MICLAHIIMDKSYLYQASAHTHINLFHFHTRITHQHMKIKIQCRMCSVCHVNSSLVISVHENIQCKKCYFSSLWNVSIPVDFINVCDDWRFQSTPIEQKVNVKEMRMIHYEIGMMMTIVFPLTMITFLASFQARVVVCMRDRNTKLWDTREGMLGKEKVWCEWEGGDGNMKLRCNPWKERGRRKGREREGEGKFWGAHVVIEKEEWGYWSSYDKMKYSTRWILRKRILTLGRRRRWL